jgi:hypothetical protein
MLLGVSQHQRQEQGIPLQCPYAVPKAPAKAIAAVAERRPRIVLADGATQRVTICAGTKAAAVYRPPTEVIAAVRSQRATAGAWQGKPSTTKNEEDDSS